MEMEGASLVLAASFLSAPLLSSGPLSFAGSLSRLREKAGSLFSFLCFFTQPNAKLGSSLVNATNRIYSGKKKADGGFFLFCLFIFCCFFCYVISIVARSASVPYKKTWRLLCTLVDISLSVTKVRPKSILYVAQKEVRETCSLPEAFQIYFFTHQETADSLGWLTPF